MHEIYLRQHDQRTIYGVGNYSGWRLKWGGGYEKRNDTGGRVCMACEDSIELCFCSALWIRANLGLVVYEYLAIRPSLLNVQTVLPSTMVIR